MNILNAATELPRNRENAFCCGAGGAQFWKEEEPGDQRISDNRFREVQQTLASATGEKVLAVGCPFCKSMLGSTPSQADSHSEDIAIKDVAELLLEGVRRSKGLTTPTIDTKPATPAETKSTVTASVAPPATQTAVETEPSPTISQTTPPAPPAVERKKWQPKAATHATDKNPTQSSAEEVTQPEAPKPAETQPPPAIAPERKKWQPKTPATTASPTPTVTEAEPTPPPAPARKKWQPKKQD